MDNFTSNERAALKGLISKEIEELHRIFQNKVTPDYISDRIKSLRVILQKLQRN